MVGTTVLSVLLVLAAAVALEARKISAIRDVQYRADRDVTSNQTVTTAKPVNHTKEVCYDHVGCFNNVPPFDNADLLLPKSPSDVGTQFLVYTREGPPGNDTVFVDYVNATSLTGTTFKANRPTKFVVHGFSNSIKTEWIYHLKDELLKNADVNVIIVVWGPGAAFPNYAQAVANTRMVATQIKMLIKHMVSMGSTYEGIHMIGHSLGAHTSGLVGQMLRTENLTLARITGMDPAEPDFLDHPTAVRLDKNDANFVDVIHTNGAPFSQGGAGMFEPCGDVDFYVNGGETQPDCPNQFSGALSHIGDLFTGHFDTLAGAVSCSHSRAHAVFIESINSNTCQFAAYPCDGYQKFQDGQCLSCGEQGCGVLGLDSDYYFATGMLFLNTRQDPPFCGHHYGVRVQIAEEAENTKGHVKIQLNGTWGVSEWLTVTRSEDAALQHGSVFNRVVVAKEIVGRVRSINLKYEPFKGSFLGWGAGKNNLNLFQISVTSGDNGSKSVFCIHTPLLKDHEHTQPVSDVETCPQ